MKLKSQIARPRVYETLPPNRIYTVCGAAWAGETDVIEIEVSTDGGQTWAGAEFLDPVRRHAWRRGPFDWWASTHYSRAPRMCAVWCNIKSTTTAMASTSSIIRPRLRYSGAIPSAGGARH